MYTKVRKGNFRCQNSRPDPIYYIRDNVVYRAYLPGSKKYFKNITTGRFKKWVELLRSYFTELFIR